MPRPRSSRGSSRASAERLRCRSLAQAGFVRIRPCRFGDHDDPRFAEVEEESRFVADGEPELAFEARAED